MNSWGHPIGQDAAVPACLSPPFLAERSKQGEVQVYDGRVAVALRRALESVTLADVDATRAEMAVALAQLVDAGSVPAARELRAVLADLAAVEDDQVRNFMAAVQTPGVAARLAATSVNGHGGH